MRDGAFSLTHQLSRYIIIIMHTTALCETVTKNERGANEWKGLQEK